jgi:DNA-binding transcriptional ArsR family regulator
MKRNMNEACYQFFSTLANPTRIAILELLQEGTKNVTQISKALNQEQSMISHNLKLLERCRFIFSERKKKEHFYSLNKELMDKLFKAFAFHAKKYCPTEGQCLANQGLEKRKKEEAANPFYLARH